MDGSRVRKEKVGQVLVLNLGTNSDIPIYIFFYTNRPRMNEQIHLFRVNRRPPGRFL